MPFSPVFSVVLEGGLVLDIVVQDWPKHLPLPTFTVVDYDIEDATDDGIICVGNAGAEAVCRIEVPSVFESIPGALSPRAVLAKLGEPISGSSSQAFDLGAQLHQAIVAGDLNAAAVLIAQQTTSLLAGIQDDHIRMRVVQRVASRLLASLSIPDAT